VLGQGYPGDPLGGVAQLVERYVRNVEAEGSSPFTSTVRVHSARARARALPADVQLRDRPLRYPQGLSTELVDGSSRVPYAALW
jgi:hypothetical protein